jgi:elongation factor G
MRSADLGEDDMALYMRPGKSADWPLLSVSVSPKLPVDQEKLTDALVRMKAAYDFDPETGRTTLHAENAQQLEVIIDMLRRMCKIEADFGAPQIAYRETITRGAEIDHTYKRQTGGNGQFARVRLRFDAGAPDTGFVFASAIVGGAVPDAFVPGVIKGIEDARAKGLLAGYPLIDFKATLIDGAYHDIDSSAATFEIAAREAFAELGEKAAPVVLEPIMLLEIMVPKACTKAFLSDLKRRRGKVVSQLRSEGDSLKGYEVLDVAAPLSNLSGYYDALREMAKGSAAGITFQSYDHYAPVPVETPPDGVFPPAVGMRA